MLTETAIIEINNLLSLVDSYFLNQHEISLLNKLGADPESTCEYYDTTQTVLENRSKTDTSINASLNALQALAVVDGCEITLEPEAVPEVNIPIFGGGLE